MQVVSCIQGPHSASETNINTEPDSYVPKASQALAHTLRLLRHPDENSRSLEAISNPTASQETAEEPLPVCSQSKYLCQVHTLHSPKPRPPLTVQSPNPTPLPADLGRESRSSLRRQSIRTRLAGTSAARLRLFARGAKQTSPKEPETSSVADHPASGEPGFIRVQQHSRKGGVFLPLRLQVGFQDFVHPMEGRFSRPDASLWQTLEAMPQKNQSLVPNEWLAGDGKESLSPSEQGLEEAEETLKALNFRQVRRFFQVDVLPSALWWLQKTVAVDRRTGPLLLAVGEESADK